MHRVRASPWRWPSGWSYRRWSVGATLPALFLSGAFFWNDWAPLGLPGPPPGFRWVRFGPDLLLVNVVTGRIVDAAYGVFY
jgi:Ni/Co efflux regulator RcnB